MATKAATAQVQSSDNAEETTDGPLMDGAAQEVKKLLAKGKERGYITIDELNAILPQDRVSSEQIEDTMTTLSEMGINVIDGEESDETTEKVDKPVVVAQAGNLADDDIGRTDDPVRMYLREMGSVELLSREGEIAIAKRIEAGRDKMIGALCESPLTMQAITHWHDALNEEKILLRDVIDLDATYGASPDGLRRAAALNNAAPANNAAPGNGAAHPQNTTPAAGDDKSNEDGEDKKIGGGRRRGRRRGSYAFPGGDGTGAEARCPGAVRENFRHLYQAPPGAGQAAGGPAERRADFQIDRAHL